MTTQNSIINATECLSALIDYSSYEKLYCFWKIPPVNFDVYANRRNLKMILLLICIEQNEEDFIYLSRNNTLIRYMTILGMEYSTLIR